MFDQETESCHQNPASLWAVLHEFVMGVAVEEATCSLDSENEEGDELKAMVDKDGVLLSLIPVSEPRLTVEQCQYQLHHSLLVEIPAS